MRKFLFPFLLLFVIIADFHAAPFTSGNIVVVRLGDGVSALSSAAAGVFLDEYTPGGVLVQTIQMPVILSGLNKRFVNSGSATSEGNLTLSSNGQYITLGGYDTIPGFAGVVGAAGISRVIGMIDYNGNINTSTSFTDGYAANNIRSTYTIDGTSFWTGGTGTGAAGGVRYVTFGASTSTQLNSTLLNTRFVYIYNSQLYVSASSGAFLGINTIGTGIPTTTGQTAVNYINASTGSSSYGFAFSPDGNTCYVADDRTTTAGGVQKWLLSGGVWTLAYTLNPASGEGCRGITVDFTTSNPTIYVTTTNTTLNKIDRVVDAGAGSPFTLIATSGTNKIFRGVSFAPTQPLPPPPPAPGLVSPANNSTGNLTSLNLVWNKSATAVSYRVQLATDIGFTNIIVNDSTLTDSIKTVSGLSPLTNYWWRVNAKNTGGTSSYSTVFTFKTLGVPFQLTGPFVPANGSTNQPTAINFAWPKEVDQTLLNIPSGISYWFELVTDSVALTNLVRDTTLTDTNKTVSGLNNSTNYYWRVKAKNQIGYGAFSNWQRFATVAAIPPPPALVSPSNTSVGNLTALNLVWNKSASAVTYRVQLATDAGFSNIIVNDSTLTDSIKAISGLSPLTNYWWRVNAKNAGGTSSFSSAFTFKTLGVPFQISGTFVPANGSTNQPTTVNFKWPKEVDQTLLNIPSSVGYWFELVTDSVTLANLVRDTTLIDTNKTVSGLSNSTNYFWRVKAKNQIGYGSFSYWQRFSTSAAIPPPPPAPALVSPGNNSVGNLTSLNLVWNKSATAVTYRVQLATDAAFSNIIVNDSTLIDSIKAVSGLSPLTNYWWRVNAKNAGGTSSFSSAFSFRTLGVPFQITSGFVPANGATNQPISINFRWSKPLDQTLSKNNEQTVSNYWFELATDTVTLANLVRDTTLTDTNKTVGSLIYSTNYYWRVKAKNQIGYGSFSFWQKFTTMPLPPAIVTLKVIPGGFYNSGTGRLNSRDTLRVYLVDSASCTRVDSNTVVVDSLTFTASLSFSNVLTGNFYLYVYQRNHLPVASRFKIGVVRNSTVSYDLTTDSAKAYGFNMIKVSNSPVRWAMIPADANRDEFIDGLDQTIWVTQNGLDGYRAADFNGDGFVDGLDQTIWIGYNGMSSFLPCQTPFIFVDKEIIRRKLEKMSSTGKAIKNTTNK